MKVLGMFKEGVPEGEIGMQPYSQSIVMYAELNALVKEKASIDEAFIDFSRPVRDIILQRYPHLAHVPVGADVDTPLPPPPPIDWRGRGEVVPVHPEAEGDNKADPSGAPEGGVAVEERQEEEEATTWHDVALSIAAELMAQIREDIRDRLGYTTSAVRPTCYRYGLTLRDV